MVQNDILGETPLVGDIIIYNPPLYKGLIYGICMGYTSAGLPEVKLDEKFKNVNAGKILNSGYYSPKTGFIVKKQK